MSVEDNPPQSHPRLCTVEGDFFTRHEAYLGVQPPSLEYDINRAQQNRPSGRFCCGDDPTGNRTRVSAVKGPRPSR